MAWQFAAGSRYGGAASVALATALRARVSLEEIPMLIRKVAAGTALAVALALSGCKHCHDSCSNCGPTSLKIGPPPCNNCGGPGGPGVIVPPPGPGPAPGAFNPSSGPYGPSSSVRKV
jgi:hypothetical protein